MPANYTITVQGKNLKVDNGLVANYLPISTLLISSQTNSSQLNPPADAISLTSAGAKVTFGVADIISIDGATPAASMLGVVDQLTNLLPLGTLIAGANDKFHDEFGVYDNASRWLDSIDPGDRIEVDGNTAGSSFLKISRSAIAANTETNIISRKTFRFPFRLCVGLTLSQRILGEEHYLEFVEVDGQGNLVVDAITDAPIAISGNITITTNVATVNTSVAHGLNPQDRVVLFGCLDSRLNVGTVVVASILSPTQFTIPLTLGNATYTATNGQVLRISPVKQARNGAAILMDGTNSANGIIASRTDGSPFMASASTNFGTNWTDGLPALTQAFAYSMQPRFQNEFQAFTDRLMFATQQIDTLNAATAITKRSQTLPNFTEDYAIRVRSRNLPNKSVPVARIVSAVKTGTTTATVTTDVAHGLTTSDFVHCYGARDQTNFPNLATAGGQQVASVVNATTFTIVWGGAVTATSQGGAVIRINGSAASSAIGQVVSTVQRTANLLTVVGNTTWTGIVIGDTVRLHGVYSTGGVDQLLDGRYKVANVTGTSLILVSSGADFGAVNCGGAVFKETDIRLHFVRVMDYNRTPVEVVGGVQTGDIYSSAPVSIQNTPNVAIAGTPNMNVANTPAVNLSQLSGTAPTVAATQANLRALGIIQVAPLTTAEVASAARTATGNSGVIAQDFGQSLSGLLNITAVSGTTPTLDIVLQESFDNGTTWQDTYHVPRFTATGTFTIPSMTLGGRRRWVWTIGGTTPSFTFAITTMMGSANSCIARSFFDRSINPNATGNGAAFNVEGCYSVSFLVNSGAATTGAIFQPEFSMDGSVWYSAGPSITSQAGLAIAGTATVGLQAKFARLRVSTAGSGQTLNYVSIFGTN